MNPENCIETVSMPSLIIVFFRTYIPPNLLATFQMKLMGPGGGGMGG